MAKVAIKSEKLSPFGGIFSIMEQFDYNLSSVIDSTLGMRRRLYGYQYSEIIRSLMSVYFCGGSCIEDVTTHLMYHLPLYPILRTCSADTILRAIKELTQDNIAYTSDTGKTYDLNTADMLNTLLLNCLLSTGQFVTPHLTLEKCWLCLRFPRHGIDRASSSLLIWRWENVHRLELYTVGGERYEAPLVQIADSTLEDFLADMELTVYRLSVRLVCEGTIAVMLKEILMKPL